MLLIETKENPAVRGSKRHKSGHWQLANCELANR